MDKSPDATTKNVLEESQIGLLMNPSCVSDDLCNYFVFNRSISLFHFEIFPVNYVFPIINKH